MLQIKSITIVLAISLSVYGCTTTKPVAQGELSFDYNTTNITVRAKDGRILQFYGGNYYVEAGEAGSIEGKARLIINSVSNESKEWEGVIQFSEIESITTTESSVLGTTVALGVVGVTAYLLLILFPPETEGDY